MIYCVTQPLKNYGAEIEGERVGLFYSYDPLLFNLITRASRVPFMYEQGSGVPVIDRLAEINGIEAFENSIEFLKPLLYESPMEMMETLCANDLDYLPLAGYWQGQNNLKFILQARAYQWLRYQSSGNVLRMTPRQLDEVQEAVIEAANTYKN